MTQLYIANKNYSSWSLRPWVLMRQLGIGFEEIALRFDFSEGSPFRRTVARVSPAGRVPVLVDDGFAVWDTLAIAEYLHERFPAAGVWPEAPQARARARTLCAEMHAGFGALRQRRADALRPLQRGRCVLRAGVLAHRDPCAAAA